MKLIKRFDAMTSTWLVGYYRGWRFYVVKKEAA